MGGEGVKVLLRPANFTLHPDATLTTEIHKTSVRIKAPNSQAAASPVHQMYVVCGLRSSFLQNVIFATKNVSV